MMGLGKGDTRRDEGEDLAVCLGRRNDEQDLLKIITILSFGSN